MRPRATRPFRTAVRTLIQRAGRARLGRRRGPRARRRIPGAKRAATAAIASGCTVHPAPTDLDSLMRTLWSDVDRGRDDVLRRDLAAIDDLLDLDALGRGEARGSQGNLTDDSVSDLTFLTPDGAPADPPDVSLATGLHLIGEVPCTEGPLLDVMLYPDQGEIYGNYAGYFREYDDDPEAFRRGEVDRLSWSGEIQAFIPFPVGATYTYFFIAQVRRVALDSGESAYLTRTWMPTPAAWDKDGPAFEQDYQLEVFMPIPDRDAMLHVYPIWRVMRAAGFDMEVSGMQVVTLDQMAKWDRRTGELCTKGLHPAEE